MPINSPRKIVPLASGDEVRCRPGPSCTKRAFFCSIVVEGAEGKSDVSPDYRELLQSFGDRIQRDRGVDEPVREAPSPPQPAGGNPRPNTPSNKSVLAEQVNELVVTERNYVQRLRLMKELYADPLRSYAKNKDTAIIPAYEAKTIFGNLDSLLPANESFLQDLEQMQKPNGPRTVGGVGDVALKHFKDLRTFDCYKNFYSKREEAQEIFQRETAKKSSTGFSAFIERIKYSTNDPKNRVGLRELLMEPVQRVPRYTLLFREMVKCMAENDSQRKKLLEADEIASRIASADPDEHQKTANIQMGMRTVISDLPPNLISSKRHYIDSIDVVDNNVDALGPGSIPASGTNDLLHCTLYLFDDKILIVKRSSAERSGQAVRELDGTDKPNTPGGRAAAALRRVGMSFKGALEVVDCNATDAGGSDFHMYLEDEPFPEQEGRWAGRPFRVLTAVLPGTGRLDTERTIAEKRRFLDNLWLVQARYRTRSNRSVATRGDEFEVESRGGKLTYARGFYNVFTRNDYFLEPKKTKVVVHIDPEGNADPLPFGLDSPPHVVIRVQPLPGELCRYSVFSDDPSEDPEEDVVQNRAIPRRVITTINQFGLFKFRTHQPSRPATPSGPNRSRAHIFGLDVLSRNLFGSSKSKDSSILGSTNSHRRAKSAAVSRSSTMRTDTDATSTTTTLLSSSKFTQGTYSTAATSLASFAMDDSSIGRRSNRSRKLVKRSRSRSRSPGRAKGRESDFGSDYEVGNDSMRRRARSLSVTRRDESFEYSDVEDADTTTLDFHAHEGLTESDMNLSMRLELARRNSQNQHEQTNVPAIDMPIEETIYEEEPPLPATRPASRSSRLSRSANDAPAKDLRSLRSVSPQPTFRSMTPTQSSGAESSRKTRPLGPRSASPFMPTSPTITAMHLDIESTLASLSPERKPSSNRIEPPMFDLDSDQFDTSLETPTKFPRTSRMPIQSTPKKKSNDIVPLSIKKKAYSMSAGRSPSPHKVDLNGSPALKRTRSSDEEDGIPPAIPRQLFEYRSTPLPESFAKNMIRVAESTREDLEASLRSAKKIKLEINSVPSSSSAPSASSSNDGIFPQKGLTRTPTQVKSAATREAQARMEEMRALIGQRPSGLKISQRGSSNSVASPGKQVENSDLKKWTETLTDTAMDIEDSVSHAASSHASLEKDLRTFISAYKECTSDLKRAQLFYEGERLYYEERENHLQELVKENSAIIQEFNAQLESLFNSATLPEHDAWKAMTDEVSQAYAAIHDLQQENGVLSRTLQEVEAREARLVALLKKHGLIS